MKTILFSILGITFLTTSFGYTKTESSVNKHFEQIDDFEFTIPEDNPTSELIIESLRIASEAEDDTNSMYKFSRIDNGQVFNRDSIFSSFLTASTIVAEVDTTMVKSVNFNLTGPITFNTTENIVPFALFADDNGILNLKDFPQGNYQLVVTPYGEIKGKGEVGTPLTISFTIVGDNEFEFTGFTIINAETDEELSEDRLLSNNTIVNLDGLENTDLTIQANFKGDNEGITVEFREELSQESRIERFAPYVFDGNQGEDYQGKPIRIDNSSFQIFRAIATRGSGENKVIVDELDSDIFFVSFNDLVSFSDLQIGNPNADQTFDFVAGTYTIGGRIGGGDVGVIVEDRFSISSPRLVNSVLFSLSGPINYSNIENERRDNFFSLFGYTDDSFNTQQFVPGDYVFTATPYIGKNATSYQGNTVRIAFSIVEENGQNKIVMSPNPAYKNVNLQIENAESYIEAKLYNTQGIKVRQLIVSNTNNTIDTSNLPEGYYYWKLTDQSGFLTTKKLLIKR